MHIQEIRASAGNQWGCPTTDVMCTVTEVHGLQAELLFVDSLKSVQMKELERPAKVERCFCLCVCLFF